MKAKTAPIHIEAIFTDMLDDLEGTELSITNALDMRV
jgi:hypothetical protein